MTTICSVAIPPGAMTFSRTCSSAKSAAINRVNATSPSQPYEMIRGIKPARTPLRKGAVARFRPQNTAGGIVSAKDKSISSEVRYV